MAEKNDVLIIGGGNFGTCLAFHLAKKCRLVTIFDRSEIVVNGINTTHHNPVYLTKYELPSNVRATTSISQIDFSTLSHAVLVVPVQVMAEALEAFRDTPLKQIPIICASKGIDRNSKKFPLGIIQAVCGQDAYMNACILSGPSFAVEVMEKQPTAVSIGSHNPEMAALGQELFHDPYFRVYTCDDPTGLEVAGALKNVVAIAAGACVGFGFQVNTMAALITRGLAEMSRFGMALGAQKHTFMGLAGVGDLFLTCTSEKSRNYSTGYHLAKGWSLERTLASLGSVAEGVFTAQAAKEIAIDLKIDAPLTLAVNEVLFEGVSIDKAFQKVINRDPKSEAQ